MNRRTFLKIAGIGSIAVAAGCTTEPEKNLFTLVQAPDDMVVGKATWYASTCRECPAGCGVLAKNREGRIIKLEGNPVTRSAGEPYACAARLPCREFMIRTGSKRP
jgi:anaerobic selenocysteine-containing dehydrogenase